MEAQTVTSSQPAAAQKALPETQEGVQGVVAPILQQRGADVTVRQVREDLLAAGYTEADINAKSELIKQSCFSLIPEDPKADGDKGDAKAKKEKKNKKNAEAQPAANFVFPVNPFTVLPPQEMVVGRFTAEEDALLMQAMDASLHARTHEVPLEVARTVLAGDKIDMAVPANHKTWKNWVRDVWREIALALPRRKPTACYDRGRRLLQDTKRGQWTPEEMEKIAALAIQYKDSPCKWKLIGEEVGRPAASCKDIYRHRILGSGDQIKKGVWSADESIKLEEAVNAQLQEMKGKEQPVKTDNAYMMGYGDVDVSWIKVSKCITGRTPEQCRSRWRVMAIHKWQAETSGQLAEDSAGADKKDDNGADKKDDSREDKMRRHNSQQKKWTPQEDLMLAQEVLQQVIVRKISNSIDIRWKHVHVPGRPGHQSKERWRRLCLKCTQQGVNSDKLDVLVNAISAMQEAEHIAQTQRGKRRKAMQGIPNFAPPEVDANMLEMHKRQMQQHYMNLQSLGGQAAAQPAMAVAVSSSMAGAAKKRLGRKRKADDDDKDDSDSTKNTEQDSPAPAASAETAEQGKGDGPVPEPPQPPKEGV